MLKISISIHLYIYPFRGSDQTRLNNKIYIIYTSTQLRKRSKSPPLPQPRTETGRPPMNIFADEMLRYIYIYICVCVCVCVCVYEILKDQSSSTMSAHSDTIVGFSKETINRRKHIYMNCKGIKENRSRRKEKQKVVKNG